MRQAIFYIILGIIVSLPMQLLGQSCDPSTPTFTFDLSGSPDSVWTSPNINRVGLCCGLDPNASPPIRCVEFFFTLDSNSQGIRFDIASGAIPPGSLGYQIGCGPVLQAGEEICLDGPGPHRLTFCKPGNNRNRYSISAIPKPTINEPITISDGCSGMLVADGYEESSITWESFPYDSVHTSYLTCTSGCDTTFAFWQPGAPDFVDYQVTGTPKGGCEDLTVSQITRIFFVNDKSAQIEPQDPVICYGASEATITANGIGGAPPYEYLWSTGETTQSIDVGEGTYWVEISDTTSCPVSTDTVTVNAYTIPIIAEAGPIDTSCSNNANLTMQGTVQLASGGYWSGGQGTYLPDSTDLNATYIPSATEIANGVVNHSLTTTGNGGCLAESDDVVQYILPAPTVDAGNDGSVCANNLQYTLQGTIDDGSSTIWIGGTGNFFPSRNDLNAVYEPSAAEVTAGSVTLTLSSTDTMYCNPVTDQVTLTITPAPTVDAGLDQIVCANNNATSLNANFTVATGVSWSGGTGTFTPDNVSSSTTYIPSATEIAAGSVTLTATTTGNGNCLAVADQMNITITPAPVVEAGPADTICANNAFAPIAGTVTIASGGIWSNGTGTFSNGNTALINTYTPSSSEITDSTFTLYLTSTGNGDCLPVEDSVVIEISHAPIVDAGPDISACSNNASFSLNGTVQFANGGFWSGSSGSYAPNNTSLTASYTPTATEVNNGSMTLTLTSTGNGECLPVADQLNVVFTPSPTANAGVDQTVCANNPDVNLSGAVTVATGGTWLGGGGVFAPDNNTLNATYTPSAAEITASNVSLTLLTTGNGNCIAVSDQMTIAITPAPVVNPGPDVTVCADTTFVPLTGTVSVTGQGIWSSSGSGTFSPSNTDLGAQYIPSPADTVNGVVDITLTSTNNGNCLPVDATKTITLGPKPGIDAGPDITICANNATGSLTATTSGATGVRWSGSSGSFSNSTAYTTNYIASSAEITAGTTTLTVTTEGTGLCNAVSDQVDVIITPAPTADAGSDFAVCANNPDASLAGQVTVATGGQWSGGNGSYTPNANDLNAVYTPSSGELALGTATLTLTTTGNGDCLPVTDQLVITIQNPTPEANAGADEVVCGDATQVSLNGAVIGATGGIWSTSGTGTFLPNATTLNAAYEPSQADTADGTVTLTLTTTGTAPCAAVSDDMVITFTDIPVIDAGPDKTVCANNVPVLQFDATGNKGRWTGGTGSFYPNDSTLNAVYEPVPGDIGATLEFVITTITNGACPAERDTVYITFTPGPTVNLPADFEVCADTAGIALNATLNNSATMEWLTAGSGTFSPNNTSAIATYIPSTQDTTNGSVRLIAMTTDNGICEPHYDTLEVTITPAPTVDAGPDQTICADYSGVAISGSTTIATGGTWTSNGTGNFINNTQLSTTYEPSAVDTANGSVVLTLTTTGNGNCKAISDQAVVTINPAPWVQTAPDFTVCADTAQLTISGNIAHATGGRWTTTGTGTFTPDNTLLTIGYIPSSTDTTNNLVEFVLTSRGNGLCQAMRDTLQVTITPAPSIDLGPDQLVCADSSGLTLTATTTIATQVQWNILSGSGSFSPDNGSLNPTYNFTSTDTTNGFVVLEATTTDNGDCQAVTDAITITINPAPTVSTGSDVTICADQSTIDITGVVTVAAGATWDFDGNGSLSLSNDNIDNTYTVDVQDTINGRLKLWLTSTGNGFCQPVTDTMVVTITPAPTVDAGADAAFCADATSIPLAGIITVAGGGQWSTDGTGTFSTQSDNLITNYIPTPQDTVNGSVNFTLTTINNGNCLAVNDTKSITFTPSPDVDAGPYQTICADATSITLDGTVLISGGGRWSTDGTGAFAPNDSTLNATYTPTLADTTAGTVTFTLTTIQNGACNPVTDDMVLTITPAPTVEAGSDIYVCAAQSSVALNGTVTTTGDGVWSTLRTGTFINPNTLSTNYLASTGDRNGDTTILYLTSAQNGTCNPVIDSLLLSFAPSPTIDAGPETICADNAGPDLSVTYTNATSVIWSASGTGAFSPNNTVDNPRYTPSAADISNGSVSIEVTTVGANPCPDINDNITLNITPAPTLDAGMDQIVCEDTAGVEVIASITIASGVIWSASGGGTFTPSNIDFTPSYSLSAIDRSNGFVNLIATTTGNGLCNPVVDTVIVDITPAPTVNAGPDQIVCPDLNSVNLNGIVTVAAGGNWTTNGTGTFNPSNDENSSYNLSPQDKIASPIKLILTTTGNGDCHAYSDSLFVNVLPLPAVSAGPTQVVCESTEQIAFTGSVDIATGGYWTTTGSGTFSPDSSAFTVVYTPSAADKTGGVIDMMFTNTLDGACIQITDTVQLSFVPDPIADAGEDIKICSTLDPQNLNGVIQNASSGYWTTSGSGTFTPDSSAIATYTPSTLDTALGVIDLVLTTDGDIGCFDEDSLQLVLYPSPEITLNYIPACDGQAITLITIPENFGIDADSSFRWYKDGALLEDDTLDQLMVNSSGTYVVNYEVGICNVKDTSVVTFNPNPIPDLKTYYKFCKETDITIDLDAGPADMYYWPTLDDSSQTVTISDPGVYPVEIINQFLCIVNEEVVVADVCPPRIFTPNAFSPDGDGINEGFRVYAAYVIDFELTVFNRWGEIIFYTRDVNQEWDGTYRGKLMPSGIYPYTIKYKPEFDEYGTMEVLEGKITLIR